MSSVIKEKASLDSRFELAFLISATFCKYDFFSITGSNYGYRKISKP
jgi:hypothetical protein